MLFYLALVFVLSVFFASLITPGVFEFILQIWPAMPWPFSRVYDRVFLFAILVLLYFFRKHLSLKQLFGSFQRLNIKTSIQRLGAGILLAIGTSLVVLLLMYSQEMFISKEFTSVKLLLKILAIVPAALLIAVIEEFFFRVLLLSSLRRTLSIPLAVLAGSLIYAGLHFIAPNKSFQFVSGDYFLGFTYLAAVMNNIIRVELVPQFIGLLLIGLLLNTFIIRSASVLFCIGLHAGWIIILKVTKYLFIINVPMPEHTLAVRYFLVGQPYVWLSFVVVFLIGLFLIKLNFFTPKEFK